MNPLKIIFAGTPHFSVPALNALLHSSHKVIAIYTQPDRPAGRGQKLIQSPVKQLALAHHIPVYQPTTLRDPEAQNTLKNLTPDLMIVAAYGLILPKTVLAIPQLGCINIHASLLPRWRGAAPIQHAILNGDTITGITLMQMEAGLDTGPELYRVACDIGLHETAGELQEKLATLGAQALNDTLSAIAAKTLIPIPQDEKLATYAHKIEKKEALIDWTQAAHEIDRKIRAFNPWPIAFSYLNHEMVRLWKAIPLSTDIAKAPGTLLSASKEGIDVATGQGILRLLTLQLPGGKPLSALALLNSKKQLFSPGNRFI